MDKISHGREVLKEVISRLCDKSKSTGKGGGFPTGFHELDRLIGGLRAGELTVIGGEASIGKTSLCLRLAQQFIFQSGFSIFYFSLKISKEELMLRMLSSISKIDIHRLRIADLCEEELKMLAAIEEDFSKVNIHIHDVPGVEIQDIIETARKKFEIDAFNLFIVDSLENTSFSKSFDSSELVLDVSRQFKELAGELNIPVIVTSSLDESVANREGHWPCLQDLPGMGALAYYADTVMLLHRQEYYMPDEDNRGITDLIVAKNSRGPIGNVKLYFKKECVLMNDDFENITFSTL